MVEVNQKATLVSATPHAVLTINKCARVCYDSSTPDDFGERRQFVRNLIHNGHETPLEFVSFLFHLTTDRGTSHELVRHRLASFQQQSTRYVRFERGMIPFIRPLEEFSTDGAARAWREACEHSEKGYFALINMGCKRQIARQVLNNSLATSLMMKMNLREYRHFLKLRAGKGAHPAMQMLALLTSAEVLRNVPDADVLLEGCPVIDPYTAEVKNG